MYESQSRVMNMTTTPAGRFVRVTLENGKTIRTTPREVECCDLRVGDTLSCDLYSAGFGVRLDMRPDWSVPFSA